MILDAIMTVLIILLFIDMGVISFISFDLSYIDMDKRQRFVNNITLIFCVIVGIILSSVVFSYAAEIY